MTCFTTLLVYYSNILCHFYTVSSLSYTLSCHTRWDPPTSGGIHLPQVGSTYLRWDPPTSGGIMTHQQNMFSYIRGQMLVM